jgi:ABC-type bacteriocin/lantibiotic exporter with double-glycine peptidase domain
MKNVIDFWVKNTRVPLGSLMALLGTGAAQVIAIHMLIQQREATATTLIMRGVLLIVLPFLATFSSSRIAAYSTKKLQAKLLDNLSKMGTKDLEQLPVANFSKAATLDVDFLLFFWRELFINLCFNVPVLLYLVILLLMNSEFLVIVGLGAGLLVLGGVAYKVNYRVRLKQRMHHHANISLQEGIRNYLDNVFQFRLYRGESSYLNGLHSKLAEFSRLSVSLSQFRQMYVMYISAVLLLLLWGGLWLLQQNESISPAEVAIMTLVFLEIRRIGTELLSNISTFQRASESVKVLTPWLSDPTSGAVEPAPVVTDLSEIAVRNLRFRYREGGKVIRYPDIDISAGSRIWLKGRNGRGKSTLWKILTGLYSDTSTVVWINGEERKTDGRIPVLARMAAVTEPARCYSGLVWEIIGNFTKSREQVVAWLTDRQLLHTFDNYPNRLDTSYESSTRNLSAGQLKWLLIVQAFFQQPDILILDEPFSSLDTERQKITLGMINALPRTVTLVLVTHHDLPMGVDKIILLDS